MLSHLENGTGMGPWYEGTAGERIAVRLSSTDANGAYAIVESVAAPGCSPPMHLHRNEEEHFVVLAGAYRILSRRSGVRRSGGYQRYRSTGIPA